MAGPHVGNEFCRPIPVEELGDDIVEEHIEADAGEREALASRLGLSKLKSLVANLELRRPKGGTLVRVQGDFEAEVVQTCVVSLEPVDARITETFEGVYTLAPALDMPVEQEFSLADDDPPEPVEQGVIDMGEAVVQQLAVALDPYPRRPGAELPAALPANNEAGSSGERAFGALRLPVRDGES